MTVTNTKKDPENLTFEITSEFDASVDRVWGLWEDPRQLEKWWGPPTYPATVVEHDLTPGGKVKYYMTGPEGDSHLGVDEVCRRRRAEQARS
ncbi:MAG: SRPBCC domain-containing protein [Actinomycetota bacterium]